MVITINSMDFMLPTLCHLQLAPLMTTRSISLSWHLIFGKVWENNRDSGTQLAIFETKPFSTLRKLQKIVMKETIKCLTCTRQDRFRTLSKLQKIGPWNIQARLRAPLNEPCFLIHTAHRISEYQNGPWPSPIVRPPCSSPNSPNWSLWNDGPAPCFPSSNHLGRAKWIT